MKILASLLLAVIAMFSSSVWPNDFTAEELQTMHENSISTPDGKEYEMIAAKHFFGDSRFMQDCVSPSSPTPEPLKIYYIVSHEGDLSGVYIEPENAVASCIRLAVAERVFPVPPGIFVGSIELGFE